jgi:transposase
MFIKLNRSPAGRVYAQLAESHRDDSGRPRNRVIATLGRVDQADRSIDSVLSGLLRATGRNAADFRPPSVEFESSRDFGDIWALQALWEQLGFDELRRLFRNRRRSFDSEQLLRVMVFNRLCDPSSKLGVLRWLETVSMPKLTMEGITHTQLLRAMDDWVELEPKVTDVIAKLMRPLFDTELSVVFYDVTSIEVTGEVVLEDDLRLHGRSKNDRIERQFALGLVQTAEGLPIAYEVFKGNVAEVQTLLPMVERVLERFDIRRVVLVADRGLLSMDNLQDLLKIRLPGDRKLEFILAVPARRYAKFAPIVETMQADRASGDWVAESTWSLNQSEDPDEATAAVHGPDAPLLRLVVSHNQTAADEMTAKRRERIEALQTEGQRWAGKLDAQDTGTRSRGRKLSDSGAKARFFHAVAEAHLSSVIQVDLKSELFTWTINETALRRHETLDGKLILLTNVPDLGAAEVVDRYKSLADIERGFRVLKSEIEIGPVFHRLPDRIRAHAGICFLALVLHRVMRMRLRSADTGLSPGSSLELLRRIQHHRINLNGTRVVRGLSRIDDLQSRVLRALGVPIPDTEELNRQLELDL